MLEKNRATLLRALGELPAHRPPGALWEGIVAEMEHYERETALRRSLRRLPEYAPPPQVWTSIQDELHRPVYRLKRWSPAYWAAAAAILIGIAAGIWRFSLAGPRENVQYAYSVETASVPFIPVALPEDEAAIEEVGDAFIKVNGQFQYPEGARLIGELKELNEAGEELRNVLEKYGFDEQLALELTKVEIQRNQVIQKMAMRL